MLKQWIHAIGRKNLSVNAHIRICSEHFVNAKGRSLRPDEIPSVKIPSRTRSGQKRCRKPPKDRSSKVIAGASSADDYLREPMPDTEADPVTRDASVQTEKVLSVEERALLDRINELELEIKEIDRQRSKQKFRIMNIKDDDSQVLYYTGFKSYDVFKAFFDYLGPAVNYLCYSSDKITSRKKNRRHRTLPPIEECFLTLVRLRTGLTEQDIAYRLICNRNDHDVYLEQ